MRISEGETTNFTSDNRTAELVVIDRTNPDHDRETVIPASLLIEQVGAVEHVEHADLPVTIQVLRWLPNADLHDFAHGGTNPATAGVGLQYVAAESRTGSGVGMLTPWTSRQPMWSSFESQRCFAGHIPRGDCTAPTANRT